MSTEDTISEPMPTAHGEYYSDSQPTGTSEISNNERVEQHRDSRTDGYPGERTSSSITSSSKSHKRSRSSDRHRERSESPSTKDGYRRSRRNRSRSPDNRSVSPSYSYYSDKESRPGHRSSRRERERSGRDRSSRNSSSRRERDRRHDRDRERDRRRDRDRESRSRRGRGRDHERSLSPVDFVERDRRTVFVQQLAARLRTHELTDFFERAGPVRDASIVKDKVSGRSKGVAYVEFKDVDSVLKAINLTGEKLLGIPVIVQFTEAEKNRQAQIQLEAQGALDAENGNNDANNESSPSHQDLALSAGTAQLGANNAVQRNQGPAECRIYVGNINFALDENDLLPLFKDFGPIQYVHLQRDPTGKSKGYAFIQYLNKDDAEKARENMQGFPLLGRNLRVGMGGDRSQVRNNFAVSGLGPQQAFQGSAFSVNAPSVDRVGGEVTSAANAAALDDADVAGISYNKVSRDHLMRKLMREDDNLVPDSFSTSTTPPPVPSSKPSAAPIQSRCVLIQNMFDPAEESGDEWVQELEEDVKDECEDKYGKVVHVAVDPVSKGEVYLKFADIDSAEAAVKGLDGRFFGGKKLSAQPFIEMIYTIK